MNIQANIVFIYSSFTSIARKIEMAVKSSKFVFVAGCLTIAFLLLLKVLLLLLFVLLSDVCLMK